MMRGQNTERDEEKKKKMALAPYLPFGEECVVIVTNLPPVSRMEYYVFRR